MVGKDHDAEDHQDHEGANDLEACAELENIQVAHVWALELLPRPLRSLNNGGSRRVRQLAGFGASRPLPYDRHHGGLSLSCQRPSCAVARELQQEHGCSSIHKDLQLRMNFLEGSRARSLGLASEPGSSARKQFLLSHARAPSQFLRPLSCQGPRSSGTRASAQESFAKEVLRTAASASHPPEARGSASWCLTAD